jgi:hypothetical protein
MLYLSFKRWAVGFLLLIALLGILRLKPWKLNYWESAPREQLSVGYLPVTCHLTCP